MASSDPLTPPHSPILQSIWAPIQPEIQDLAMDGGDSATSSVGPEECEEAGPRSSFTPPLPATKREDSAAGFNWKAVPFLSTGAQKQDTSANAKPAKLSETATPFLSAVLPADLSPTASSPVTSHSPTSVPEPTPLAEYGAGVDTVDEQIAQLLDIPQQASEETATAETPSTQGTGQTDQLQQMQLAQMQFQLQLQQQALQQQLLAQRSGMGIPLVLAPHALPANVMFVQFQDDAGSIPDPSLFRLVTVSDQAFGVNVDATGQPQVPSVGSAPSEGVSPAPSGTPVPTPPPIPEAMASEERGSVPSAQPNAYCLVEFKRGRTAQYESSVYIPAGEFVIVTGDRGQDIGRVVRCTMNYKKTGTPEIVLGKVARRALTKEVSTLQTEQLELERSAVELCTKKVVEHGLRMSVVDAEFQFDRRKLTFYYESNERQDFRDLVRDLFRIYRARIWMSKVNGEEVN